MRTIVLAVVALLLTPAVAVGAPVTIGSGHKPGVAVAPDGTAYIAWYGPESGDTSLHFCRLPRGSSSCSGQSLLVTSGSSLTRPFVAVAGSRVVVLQHRYGPFAGGFNQVFRYTSVDGGTTFDGGVVAGFVPFDEGVVGPGDAVTVATSAFREGGVVQSLPLAGGGAGDARAGIFPARPYNGAVGLDGDAVVAVFADGASNAAFRRWGGAGSVNDAGAWAPEVGIGYADYPKLAGGSSGLFLFSGRAAGGLEVRRWNGSGFGGAVTVAEHGDDAQASFSQDGGGRLHAVWPRFAADGIALDYAFSDDGARWTSASLLVGPDAIAQTRVAAAPDHVGVAVWESGSQIRVEAVGPQPEYGRSVVLRPVSGTVRVKVRGSSKFVDLSAVDDVPLGSTVDTKRGRVELSARPSRAGAVEKIQLYSGVFGVAQRGRVTEFALSERLASCARGGALAAAKKPRSRKLWGDGKGSFRTKGRYSSATIRGTRWLVQDSCAGTLTRVVQGSVLVRAGRRSVVVRAGKRFLARPR